MCFAHYNISTFQTNLRSYKLILASDLALDDDKKNKTLQREKKTTSVFGQKIFRFFSEFNCLTQGPRTYSVYPQTCITWSLVRYIVQNLLSDQRRFICVYFKYHVFPSKFKPHSSGRNNSIKMKNVFKLKCYVLTGEQ